MVRVHFSGLFVSKSPICDMVIMKNGNQMMNSTQNNMVPPMFILKNKDLFLARAIMYFWDAEVDVVLGWTRKMVYEESWRGFRGSGRAAKGGE